MNIVYKLIITILPLILLLLKITSIKEDKDHIFDLDETKSYKGLMSLLIVYFHLFNNNKDFVVASYVYGNIGYMVVGVFFLISGYGLMKKHMSMNYSKPKHLLERELKIIIPYLIANLLCLIINDDYSNLDFFVLLNNGETIVPFSWYIVEILFLNIIFYITSNIFKNNKKIVLSNVLAYVFIVFVCKKYSFGGWWIYSTLLFVIGITIAIKEKQIIEFINNKKYIVLISLILIVGIIVFEEKKVISRDFINEVTKNILFSIIFIYSNCIISIKNKVLSFLGKISLETYLLHGIVMDVLKEYISNSLLFCICSIVLTIILSTIFNKIIKIINKTINLS